MILGRALVRFLPSLLPLALCACASTTTKKIALQPEEIEAEKMKQRVVVLESIRNQQERLAGIAYPILAAATPLCPKDVGLVAGFNYENIHSFNKDWKAAAKELFAMGDDLQVVAVAAGSPASRAGLKSGDILVGVNGTDVPTGEGAAKKLNDWFKDFKKSGGSSLSIEVLRDSTRFSYSMDLDSCCAYPTLVIQGGDINAYADGEAILFTSAMMRFANDEELAVVLAHELAHNAMDHIDAKKQNALMGSLLGAILDVATAATTGYNTGGAYTSEMGALGATAFSQDFETEADYVGMYALALAGYSLDGAPYFWRQMAQVDPKSIGIAHTHPTTVERFLRLEKVVSEIELKKESGALLRPDKKDTTKGK